MTEQEMRDYQMWTLAELAEFLYEKVINKINQLMFRKLSKARIG